MTAPDIHNSTRQEREAYVDAQWQCMGHCPSCGKCSILRGRDPEVVYHDYITGTRSYLDVTLSIRK